MRSFLGVKAIRKNPHAATAQPLKYPLITNPPNHKEEGAKKKGIVVIKHTPMPPSIMLFALAGDLTNRPQVKSPAKCAITAASI